MNYSQSNLNYSRSNLNQSQSKGREYIVLGTGVYGETMLQQPTRLLVYGLIVGTIGLITVALQALTGSVCAT